MPAVMAGRLWENWRTLPMTATTARPATSLTRLQRLLLWVGRIPPPQPTQTVTETHDIYHALFTCRGHVLEFLDTAGFLTVYCRECRVELGRIFIPGPCRVALEAEHFRRAIAEGRLPAPPPREGGGAGTEAGGSADA